MARNRFVQPDTARLALSDGDWIDVKAKLTAGEHRKMLASSVKGLDDAGRVVPDLERASKAQVLAYLLDWSFRRDGKAVDVSPDAVDSLDVQSFEEINAAIAAHADAGGQEKNVQAGEIAPSGISSSAA